MISDFDSEPEFYAEEATHPPPGRGRGRGRGKIRVASENYVTGKQERSSNTTTRTRKKNVSASIVP